MRIGVLGAANIARKVVIPSILEAKGVELAAIASESTKASDFLAQTDLRTAGGVPLRDVLNHAGVGPKAREVVFLGADRGEQEVAFRTQNFKLNQQFGRSITLENANRPEPMLTFWPSTMAVTPNPGVANTFGSIQGNANAVAPGKTPLSSMSPTIITRDGKPVLILGTPGGSRIITTVLQTILNVVDFQMNIQEAVDAPRIHQQWLPDMTKTEPYALSPDTRRIMESMGYRFENSEPANHVDAALSALDGLISERTAFFIRHHMDALAYRAGKLGVSLRRELQASEDFDDLMLLRDLDDAGRVPGAVVGTVDEALDFLKELERSNG